MPHGWVYAPTASGFGCPIRAEGSAELTWYQVKPIHSCHALGLCSAGGTLMLAAVQMLEAVLNVCNRNARIPACGMISQYNIQDKEGIKNLFAVGTA